MKGAIFPGWGGKIYLLLIATLCCLPTHLPAQMTLCEESAFMYSKCYELDSTGMFQYTYSHCTGQTVGMGVYQIKGKSIVFTYDTIITPVIQKQQSQQSNGVVKIIYRDLLDPAPIAFAQIEYNDITYITDTAGVLELNYKGGPVKIFQYFNRDSVIIFPDLEQFNEYTILWTITEDFISKGSVDRMVKSGNRYKMIEFVLKYVERKNAFKKERRVTYYKIISN